MAPRSVWTFRMIYVGLAFLIMFLNLLPLGGATALIPAPDLVLAMTLAWALRRPDYVPIGLIVVVGLMGDALLNRPLGLYALLTLIGAEFARRSVDQSIRLTPSSEATIIAPIIIGVLLAERLIYVLVLADPPPLGAHLLHGIVTMLFYPVVALFSQVVVGVRRLQPGELDSLGARA